MFSCDFNYFVSFTFYFQFQIQWVLCICSIWKLASEAGKNIILTGFQVHWYVGVYTALRSAVSGSVSVVVTCFISHIVCFNSFTNVCYERSWCVDLNKCLPFIGFVLAKLKKHFESRVISLCPKIPKHDIWLAGDG